MAFFRKKKQENAGKKLVLSASDEKFSSRCFLFVVEELLNDCKSRSVVDFANYCLKNGIKVIILAGRNDIKNLTKDGIILNLRRSCFVVQGFLFFEICRLCKKYKVDVVCNCCKIAFPSIVPAGLISGAKNAIFLYNVFDVSSRAKYFLTTNIVKNDAIFALSKSVCDFLLDNYEFDVKKLHNFPVVINGKEIAGDFIGTGRICDALEELGSNAIGRRVLLCFCNYNDLDNCFNIVEALKFLKKRDDFVFVFVGLFRNTNKSRLQIVKKIKEYGLQDIVRLIDEISDRRVLLSLSYVVICLQDDYNDFLNFYCEAGFMKKPFITTTSSNTRKAIIHGKNGFLIRKNTIMDIYSSLLGILEMTESKYNEMCDNAYDYARKYFDNNKAYLNIFEELLRISNGSQKRNIVLKKKFFRN